MWQRRRFSAWANASVGLFDRKSGKSSMLASLLSVVAKVMIGECLLSGVKRTSGGASLSIMAQSGREGD
jgi:hypothetical protein